MKNTKTLLATFIASATLSQAVFANDSFDELDKAHFEVQREMAYEFEGCSAQEFAMEQAKVKKLKSMMHERQEEISSLERNIKTLKASQKSCNTRSLEEQVASLNAQNSNLEKQVAQLTQSLKQANADLLNKSSDSATIATLRKNLSTTQSQLSETQIQNNALISKITQLRSKLAQSQTTAAPAVTPPPVTRPVIQPAIDFSGQEAEKLKINKVIASSNNNWVHYVHNGRSPHNSNAWYSRETENQFLKFTLRDSKYFSQFNIFIPENSNGKYQPPKSISLHFEDGSSQNVTLRDLWGWQKFDINPVKSTTVEVRFNKQYKHPTIENEGVRVGEIEFYGYE